MPPSTFTALPKDVPMKKTFAAALIAASLLSSAVPASAAVPPAISEKYSGYILARFVSVITGYRVMLCSLGYPTCS